MCSFIFSCKDINNIDTVNFYTKFRGPDYTNLVKKAGLSFVHNLLSITGDFVIQPFVDDNIICKKHSFEFIKKLDGEFAIVLIDLNKKRCVFSTDIFKTKPIFYSDNKNNLGCATYRACLTELGHKNIKTLQPNTAKIFDLNTMTEIKKFKIHSFSLSQHKTTFNDWCTSYQRSIRKRTVNLREKIFIGLSSGYDSGAIACELFKQSIPFKSYSVMGTENTAVIQKRKRLLNNNVQFKELFRHSNEYRTAHEHIQRNTEPFQYVTYSNSSDYNEFYLSLIDDNGSNALSLLCNHAINDGNKILLSGKTALL